MQDNFYTPNGDNDVARLMDAMDQLKEQKYNKIDETVFDDPAVAQKYNETVDSLADVNNRFLMRLNDAQSRIADNNSLRTYINLVKKQKEPIEAIREMGTSLKNKVIQSDERQIAILSLVKQAQSTLQPVIDNLEAGVEAIDGGDLEGSKDVLLRSSDLLSDVEGFLASIRSESVAAFSSESYDEEYFDTVEENARILSASYGEFLNNCYINGARLYRISRDIDSARNDMYRQNSRPTFIDRLKVFAIDHMTLAWRMFNHMVEYERLKIEQINNPDRCKFGLWCENLDIPVLKESKEFQDCFDAHNVFHTHAVNCFIAKEESDFELANEEFEQVLVAWQRFDDALVSLAQLARENGYDEETEVWVFK